MSELQDWKRDGFRGEKMIVLPTESFQDYITLSAIVEISDFYS